MVYTIQRLSFVFFFAIHHHLRKMLPMNKESNKMKTKNEGHKNYESQLYLLSITEKWKESYGLLYRGKESSGADL